MLLGLALIPVIALLVFIYFKDKNEKEPIGLLIGLFFAGMGTIITALIGEGIGSLFLQLIFPYDCMLKGIIDAMIIVGPIEELGKFLVLWLITWRNKHFNYSFDAIVYSVFVSLGFAAFENVGYVFENGLGTAFMRMFSAVPGHACFAVFMGFFYSKAKYASVTKKSGKAASNIILAMLVPILIHGVYDAIIMGGEQSGYDLLSGLSFLLWIVYVIALFVCTFILVIKASKNDFCIVTLPTQVQTVYRPRVLGNWNCACGKTNALNFCSECGKPRPMGNSWYCQKCGTLSTFNFCGECGSPKA